MTIQPVNPANYTRRRVFSLLMDMVCSLAALVGLIVLALILFELVQKGMHGLSPTL